MQHEYAEWAHSLDMQMDKQHGKTAWRHGLEHCMKQGHASLACKINMQNGHA
jgi:hypothetical protein